MNCLNSVALSLLKITSMQAACFVKMNVYSFQEMEDVPLSRTCKWQLTKGHYEHLFKIYSLSNMGKQ
jgi:hypothetical protein